MDLMNKVSIVTGGAQGLGKAIALELARKGSHLWLGRRRQPCRCFFSFRRSPVHYGRNP
jgi:NAD(P)-dependent dehydrogenase (short-subunit alcohol dehydrogenase family)